jgi:hypothetical protein
LINFRWCAKNQIQLKEMNSSLEFNLHRLNFIKLISQGTKQQLEALKYARNFTPFANTCKKGNFNKIFHYF